MKSSAFSSFNVAEQIVAVWEDKESGEFCALLLIFDEAFIL